jgi:hypothetical protein
MKSNASKLKILYPAISSIICLGFALAFFQIILYWVESRLIIMPFAEFGKFELVSQATQPNSYWLGFSIWLTFNIFLFILGIFSLLNFVSQFTKARVGKQGEGWGVRIENVQRWLILFVLLVLVSGIVIYLFSAGTLTSVFKKDFDPRVVLTEITSKFGVADTSSNSLCNSLIEKLHLANYNFSCQPNHYSVTEAKQFVDKIMGSYNVKPNDVWSTNTNVTGELRSYTDEKSNSMALIVTDDIVLALY